MFFLLAARARGLALFQLIITWAPLRRVCARADVQFIWVCLVLLGAFTLVRPLFAAAVPEEVFRSRFVMGQLAVDDYRQLVSAARRQKPMVPRVLFVLLPAVLLALAGVRPRWQQWEASGGLRRFVTTLVVVLAWAGSTYNYNLYLDVGHWFDRAGLLALAAATWWWPLALPPFATWVVIMLWEVSSVGLGHDDFDWRPLIEVLALFACFVWLSFWKRLNTRHFLFVALYSLASYYYFAGYAKIFYGPTFSWIIDNHTSNLFLAAWQHGWLNWFLSERAALVATRALRHIDLAAGLFTVFVAEIGVIVWLAVHPRATRVWLLCAAGLHLGIFVFAGVCFWKWIAMDLALWYFLRGEGASLHAEIFKHKAVLVFGVVLLLCSGQRTYFNPTTGVAWYDTNFNELYHLQAVGKSGRTYDLDPNVFAPYDARMTQENFCYLSDEPYLTAIYGQTGNHAVLRKLEASKTAAEALAVLNAHRRPCTDDKRRAAWDTLVSRTMANINRRGLPHRWLALLGRFDHIWLLRKGPRFSANEPVVRVQVWRERTLFTGDRIVSVSKTKIHEVDVPLMP
ncbi:MAG: hypothetical protein SF187_21600 [Deltaproteobacteria bacterium]|nr:hypothetical protein [Deltaproteobacteria bacterium]